ncbi:MAG: redoxin domain-containing protein [Pseudomonadota bacterium]
MNINAPAPAIDTAPSRLKIGTKVPDLTVPLAGGGSWSLADQKPARFTLLVFFRGVHCSFCKPEVEKLNTLQEKLGELGISAFALSMDEESRAKRMANEWAIAGLPVGYALTEDDARSWGLFMSKKVKDSEPDLFSEPAAFLVRPDGTLF